MTDHGKHELNPGAIYARRRAHRAEMNAVPERDAATGERAPTPDTAEAVYARRRAERDGRGFGD